MAYRSYKELWEVKALLRDAKKLKAGRFKIQNGIGL